jgi:NADPH-dependent ferric siderophore reductase
MMDDIINFHRCQPARCGTDMAPNDSSPTAARSIGSLHRVRHDNPRRALKVLRTESVTPGCRRIVLGGAALQGFTTAAFDDHVKLIFNPESAAPVMRDYTPRWHDREAGELAIEFALHGHGPAADWARSAAPDALVTVGGPRGSFIVPTDLDWHLLIGDESALPAIARRLQELPSSTRAVVVGHVVDAADQRDFSSDARLEVQWVTNFSALVDAVRGLVLPAGDGYAWCAGEAAAMHSVREVLTVQKGLPSRAVRAAAYWKRGASGHHEKIEA